MNNEVRKLVEHYKHSCFGNIEDMKIEMLNMEGSDEDKEKLFKQAIQIFVNDKNDIKETGIEELTDILIASIRNRMAKFCSDCQAWYIVGRENRPKKFCNLCNAVMHECQDHINETVHQ